MATLDQGDVTRLVIDAGAGDRRAAEELLPLVYEQLRAIAHQRMDHERPEHTLQATALVHEAYLRLVGNRRIEWAGRAHFYAAAAEAIRRILLDHAKARGRAKRGGRNRQVALSIVDLATEHDPAEILALEEAICRLEGQDERLSQVVRLRFYAGLNVEDTAKALGLSERTVKRRWSFARAWLYTQLAEGNA